MVENELREEKERVSNCKHGRFVLRFKRIYNTFSITMKDMTFIRLAKWAHKHNLITKNRICNSEIVVRKDLKSVK